MTHSRRLAATSTVLLAAFTLFQILRVMAANNGHFVYALDDAYIHLDLADQLGRTGVYGVNPGLPASPSSSILWPLLLAPFARLTGVLEYVPLAISLLAALASAWIMPALIQLATPARRLMPVITLSLLALMTLDLPALVICGMEHALHVYISLLLALGTLRILNGEKPEWWLWSAIILSPLLRYEGVFPSLAVLGVLFWTGRRWQAIFCGCLMLLPVGGFSWFLVSQGMEPLPSSTIVKKLRWASADAPFWKFWVQSVVAVFYNHNGLVNTTGAALLLAPVATLTGVLANWRQWKSPRWAAGLAITGALAGQLFFGRFSIWETPRYEFYVLAFVAPVGLFLIRNSLNRPAIAALILLASLTAGLPSYWSSGHDIIAASRAIYLQQYQMGRLVRDYWHEPVAVNDIGLPGYRNPHFVFDMVGLADPEARRARFAGGNDWADRLIHDHRVPLVMIYDSWWSPKVRESWTPIGELFRDSNSKLGSSSVTFYTPYPDRADEIRAQLKPWSESLPRGAWFNFYDAEHPRPPQAIDAP